jgi:hypothetical protein
MESRGNMGSNSAKSRISLIACIAALLWAPACGGGSADSGQSSSTSNALTNSADDDTDGEVDEAGEGMDDDEDGNVDESGEDDDACGCQSHGGRGDGDTGDGDTGDGDTEPPAL